MKLNVFRTWLHGAFALMLAACGGGGDGGIGGTGGGGGALGSDVSIGTITAFGSVWVNGVRFNSDDATVKRDDDPITHDANNPLNRRGGLRQGMIARVKGSISGAKADEIRVDSAAKGWVQSVSGNQMIVMGQTVVIDGSTVIEDNIRPQQGDYAEVHGLVAPDGTITAAFVERKVAPTPLAFAVKGFVANHAAGGTTFQVGALNILAAGAITNDMPAGTWNGILVEVKGNACAGNPVCGTLTATKVEPDTPRGDNAKVEVEGIVTSGTSAAFNIGSQAVVTNGATVFVGGVASDLSVGTKVEVEGSISGGVLTATKVSFRESIRFEANIASVGSGTFTLQGFASPVITIETNRLTKWSGSATDFSSLAALQNVRVRGRPGSGNNVVATEVEVRSQTSSTDVRFQAIVTSAANPTLTMLGQSVNTSSISDNNFLGLSGNTIGRVAFFNAVAAGNKLVKVRGTMQGATINWNREAELEED